jgi:hypothetical protein
MDQYGDKAGACRHTSGHKLCTHKHLTLKRSVGQDEVCVCGGAGQGHAGG